jgi:hypothetical protein
LFIWVETHNLVSFLGRQVNTVPTSLTNHIRIFPIEAIRETSVEASLPIEEIYERILSIIAYVALAQIVIIQALLFLGDIGPFELIEVIVCNPIIGEL